MDRTGCSTQDELAIRMRTSMNMSAWATYYHMEDERQDARMMNAVARALSLMFGDGN